MEYVDALVDFAKDFRVESSAPKMEAYMKNRFQFLGINAPTRKEIFRNFVREVGLPPLEEHWAVVNELFARPYRELHYLALEICDRRKNKWEADGADHLENLIITNSWWDTVDWIAGFCGRHFERFPEEVPSRTDAWSESDDMWLNRVSIIFQLKYKDNMDWDLLQKYILAHIDSKEFFIQKAQGWSLRQYTKFQPDRVMKFVEAHPELSRLSQREAMKYLG